MTFEKILDQAIAMLQRRGRLTYGALKRQFDLDDMFLKDLAEELIHGQQLAVDEDGKVLVWSGGADRAATPAPPVTSSPATALQRAPLSYTPSYLTEKILDARPRLEGERKQVTVLFADIKDSTELIRDLDPEAAQQLLDPAIQRMMDAVHRYEGTVNQVLGDGIMALFGAPIAHEDHALRACYAALAMQTAMREYTEEVRRRRGLELRIRVGLNAGEVVVRAIGNDLHMDYSAVGQTTHLAARMEQLATPGSIRLTTGTLRLVEGLVQVTALGLIPVKGLTEAVEVFELVRASSVRRRLQAVVARGLTRFVGRETEIVALAQALARAGAGHGQVVAAVGTFTEGIALGNEGLRIAEAVARPGSVMIASWGIGLLALRQGDLPRALPPLERAMGICQDADLPLWFSFVAAALGAAYTLGGRVSDTVPLLTQALEQATTMERVDVQAFCRLSLGEAQMLAGRLEEAQALAEGALALAREHQEHGHQAYVLRLLGDIAARREPPESALAEAHYQQAFVLAEELGMRPLVAHCHLGLGMLYAKIGQPAQAHTELSAAIALYHAMDMTFWLPQAEAALAQVG